MDIAREGYLGFQRNRRVVVTGARNAVLAAATRILPRVVLLRLVRKLQSPA